MIVTERINFENELYNLCTKWIYEERENGLNGSNNPYYEYTPSCEMDEWMVTHIIMMSFRR